MSNFKDNEESPFEFNPQWLACYREQAMLQQQPLRFLLLLYHADYQHWSTQQFQDCSCLETESLFNRDQAASHEDKLLGLTPFEPG